MQEEETSEISNEKIKDNFSERRGSRSEGRLSLFLKTSKTNEQTTQSNYDKEKKKSKVETPRCKKCEVSKMESKYKQQLESFIAVNKSCSSSDTSDDDTKMEKKDILNVSQCCKIDKYRRDSQDDSSDSQDADKIARAYSPMIKCSKKHTCENESQKQNDSIKNCCSIYEKINLKHSLSLNKISENNETENEKDIMYKKSWNESELNLIDIEIKKDEITNF